MMYIGNIKYVSNYFVDSSHNISAEILRDYSVTRWVNKITYLFTPQPTIIAEWFLHKYKYSNCDCLLCYAGIIEYRTLTLKKLERLHGQQ